MEAATATILATAIIGTATGMGWLVIALPTKLNQLQEQINRIVENLNAFSDRFTILEKEVNEHEGRIIRLESR